MNTHTAQTNRGEQQNFQPFAARAMGSPIERDFEQLLPPEPLVEHATVPAFMRRIPHRWHIDDVRRFGDQVGRMAEAMQLAYLTTVDASLGVVRIFPLPLLRRVYEHQAVQFNWPKVIDAPALEDERKAQEEKLRIHARLERMLVAVGDAAENPAVRDAIGVVAGWVATECARLRAAIGEEVTPAS